MADERAVHRTGRTGRPPLTSASELGAVALELFTENGFDATTIDDVAEAAGIGRRTFFRYYASKNDLAWGDFDGQLDLFRHELAGYVDRPMMDALRCAVVEFNRVDARDLDQHRRRMQLILTVPALQAHFTLRYSAWRAAVEEFAAARTGRPVGSPVPQLVGHVALATCRAAYEQWLAHPNADLSQLIDSAFSTLAQGFAHLERPAPVVVQRRQRTPR